MKDEIKVGVEFLRQFLAKYGQLNQTQIDQFASKLSNYLEQRYVNHWYETKPLKGQAFRCLRLKRSEKYIDPVLEKILTELNLTLNQLGLPNDFTLWIDPGEVSVRFGDQVGYTYTIAKLNQTEQNPSLEKINNSLSSTNENESKLIVENSEKIFDEKLTAFIRQNSCNTNSSNSSLAKKDSSSDFTFNLNDLQCEEDELNQTNDSILTNELIEKFSNLSPEKRTISPPVASSPVNNNNNNNNKQNVKRNNSSNISINNGLTTMNLKNTNTSANNANNEKNRLSYNDSCYYSSSSSSCASSFGSNYDENLAQLSWYKNDQSLINQSLNVNNNINNLNRSSAYQFDNSSLLNETCFFNADSFTPSTKLNMLMNNSNPSYLNSVNLINSETSSDRSDTPNSCITTSSSMSYFMNSSPSNNFSNFSSSFGFEGFLQANENLIGKSNDLFLDSSSSSSTSTTIFPSVEMLKNDPSSTPKKGSDNEEEKTSLICQYNENNNNNNNKVKSNEKKIEKSLSPNKAKSKEDSYCGYVESFPYYYKLNRLYNALAVQKMQTERLRKAGLLSAANMNNPVAVANALATYTSMGGQFNSRSGQNGKGSSSLSSSPSSKITQSSTPPPIGGGFNSKSKNFANKNSFSMSPNNSNMPFIGHQSKGFLKNNLNGSNNKNKIGFNNNNNNSQLIDNSTHMNSSINQQNLFQPFVPQQHMLNKQNQLPQFFN